MAAHSRRWTVLRWVPLAILTAAGGVGTGLGLALSGGSAPGAVAAGTGGSLPASLQAMVSATVDARTARLSYRSVTSGPGSDEPGGSVLTGTGVVDFRSRSYRTDSVQSETETTTIGSGPTRTQQVEFTLAQIQVDGRLYQQFPGLLDGTNHAPVPPPDRWTRFPTIAGSSRSPFGPFAQSEAAQALAPLSDPDQRVTVVTVGPATVGGVATTHERATFTSLPDRCLPRDRQPLSSSRMDVWVDGRGRLVQVRTTTRQVISRVVQPVADGGSGAAPDPVDLPGTIVTRAALRLSDFGVPAHISVPRPVEDLDGSGGVAISLRAGSCPTGSTVRHGG